MDTMTKQELIDQLVKDTGLRRPVVTLLVKSLFTRTILELAKGKRLEFRDFGVFEPRLRKARSARNPKTGTVAQVPERYSVRFRPGRKMREALGKPPAHASSGRAVRRVSPSRSTLTGSQRPGTDDGQSHTQSANGLASGPVTAVVRRREVAGAAPGAGAGPTANRSRR